MRNRVRLLKSQTSTGGFTLIELLVIVGIVTMLIAILLPALAKARDMANCISCASNVRQLVMCTLMYANENKGNLPRQGQAQGLHEFSGLVGDFQEWPSDPNDNAKKDMDALLGSYVNADVTTWAAIPGQPYPPAWQVLSGLTKNPPRVLTCPSNGQDFYYRMGYAYYAGGTNDFRVTITQLWEAGKGIRAAKWGTQYGPIPGGNPVLWGDRIAYINDPGAGASGWNDSYNGGPAETSGHWNKTAGRIAGGNVGRMDGSVLWYGYYGPAVSGYINGILDYKITEAYVPNPIEITQQTAIPCDAIFIVPVTGGSYPATLNAQTNLFGGAVAQKEACAGATLAGAGTLFGR